MTSQRVWRQDLRRRGFLRLATGGMVAGSTLLAAACAGSVPTAPPTAPPSGSTAGAAATARPSAVANFPTYVSSQGGPKPDFESNGPLYEDGFMNYPRTRFKAWTRDPPGTGGDVTALVVITRPAVPNPLDRNPAWQQINKALNVNFQFNRPPAADYAAKLATVMAGNDLPDMICFRTPNNGSGGTPNLPQFLDSAMADLTPYLGGGAAKDYPFLAALPTFGWKNSGSVINNKLYLVPAMNPSLGNGFFRNVNIYDQEIGPNYTPRDGADFKRVLQQLTRPSEGRWGIATWQGVGFHVPMFAAMFGAPNNWQLDSSGKLIKDREAPQFKEAVGYVRDLFASGVYHPDSLQTTDNTAAGTGFTSGKWVVMVQGYAGTWQQQWFRALSLKPPNAFMPIEPFGAQSGAKPSVFLGTGASITTGLKKAAEARIRELLRILDWLAAPFGSEEDLLLTFGAAETDWTADANGSPTPTEASNADSAAVNWKNIVVHPPVAYAVGLPDFARATVEAERQLIPLSVEDPTMGLLSTTDNTRGQLLTNTFNDGVVDIVAGRRPLADYDQLIKEWQSTGGETIRQEYLKAIAEAAR